MKALFVSHVANFQKFNNPYIKWLQERGCEVHYASLDDEPMECADKFHKVDFRRDPYDLRNIKAFFQLVRLFVKERYDFIHCHTPIGGILTRMASVFVPKTKILYTAHGFHFYKGAPLKNFLIYRTAEMLMAHRTDALITINKEDHEAAKAFKLRKGGRLYYLNGVGVDTEAVRKAAENTDDLRTELGLPEDTFVVLTVAELIKRKNYETALKAFAKADIPNSHYLICGRGPELSSLTELCSKLGIADKVSFLGYRRDIYRILGIADVFLFTSHQEGLPISVIEAMAAGLPCIASDIRGNDQLITSENGIMCRDNDVEGFADAVRTLYSDPSLRKSMGCKSSELSKCYDIKITVNEMGEIYKAVADI